MIYWNLAQSVILMGFGVAIGALFGYAMGRRKS